MSVLPFYFLHLKVVQKKARFLELDSFIEKEKQVGKNFKQLLMD